MRNISAVLMSVIILLSITGCALTQSAKSQISDASQATLRFVYADTEIVQVLDADDATKIADIFSGKDLDGTSIPSCGFSEDISIAFGEQVFAIACDDCAIIKDCSTD